MTNTEIVCQKRCCYLNKEGEKIWNVLDIETASLLLCCLTRSIYAPKDCIYLRQRQSKPTIDFYSSITRWKSCVTCVGTIDLLLLIHQSSRMSKERQATKSIHFHVRCTRYITSPTCRWNDLLFGFRLELLADLWCKICWLVIGEQLISTAQTWLAIIN